MPPTFAAAMNNEESVQTPSSPIRVSIEVSKSILQEARILATDDNGPNMAFNSLVTQYAHDWEMSAGQTILLLELKPAKLTPNQLNSLGVKLTKELNQLTSMQNRLVG